MMQNLTQHVSKGLSWIFGSADESSEKEAPTTTSLAIQLSTTSASHDSLTSESGADRRSQLLTRLPWLITWGASLCTMLCAGLALGAFCHAGFFQRSVRDVPAPLLQDQRMDTSTELQNNVATHQQE